MVAVACSAFITLLQQLLQDDWHIVHDACMRAIRADFEATSGLPCGAEW